MLSLQDVQSARDRISGRVVRTPTISATLLGQICGVDLLLKAELFQKTGSFKVRGVFNKLLSIPEAQRSAGFVSMSAGNFAAALAYACGTLGAKATIVMPDWAVRSKVEATEGYGGEVILTEGDLMEEMNRIRDERGLTFIHPFDDPEIMAGHGTIGLEITEDVADAEVVVVPVGGGGLIGGIAAALKGILPSASVFGVEPESADAMTRSLAEGKPVAVGRVASIADGLAAPFAGEHTFAAVREFVDDVVTVADEAIVDALRLIYTRAKLACEPAGAASVAAILSGALNLTPGTRVVCVISGGNVDLNVLKGIL